MTSDGAVLKARRQVEQSTEELTRLNDELHKAKTQEAETRHGISNSQNMIADVQMHIDAKKNRIAQLKNLLHQRK
jgi:peptidoglycan hydrolase CwlO-like protein